MTAMMICLYVLSGVLMAKRLYEKDHDSASEYGDPVVMGLVILIWPLFLLSLVVGKILEFIRDN